MPILIGILALGLELVGDLVLGGIFEGIEKLFRGEAGRPTRNEDLPDLIVNEPEVDKLRATPAQTPPRPSDK